MDRAGGDGSGSRTGRTAAEPGPRRVHALFQQRVAGDDALLRLASLRFAQMGVAAEVYADTPDQLDHVLQFVPPHRWLPVVHLNRRINVLHERGRAVVQEFAGRFAGRIGGLVIHDRQEMQTQTPALIAAMRELDARLRERPGEVTVFLEYAAGLDPAWFVDVAESLQDAERVSSCLDVGHLGVRQASFKLGQRHPGLRLTLADDRLPDLIDEVDNVVQSALPEVLDVIRALGRLGERTHFHLHDGHPLVPGLPDHFSFLTLLPIPFSYRGRRSVGTMYGPRGLAAIVSTAFEACPPEGASFTLEVHQAEGRLPLDDAAGLFSHWRDTTNAERMNYWLSVLSENALLITDHAVATSQRA
jgi:hypothetical protein